MKTRYRIFNLIVAFLLISVVIGNVFAWFSGKNAQIEINGASAGAYFAYGDGTATAPYGITEEKHLFNLAWLQNTGKIPEKTYFELGDDITIEKGYVLPPIGNAENPFDSTFNGNGKTIDGLIISTNKNVLYGAPADSGYSFSNAVGMFGMTGENSEIKNFILKDPTVEVAENGGGQSTHYAENETADKKAVGIAIGYVNGKASSIGVNGGKFLVRKDDYSTFNSILGNMSEDAMNNNNLTGGTVGTGGSGSAFGASFDVESLIDRLKKIHVGKYGVDYTNDKSLTPLPGASIFLPDIEHSNDDPVPESYEKVPFTVDAEQSTYTGSNAREAIAKNNIGYIVGSQNKTQTKTLKFADKLVHPDGENPSKDTHTNWVLPGKDGTANSGSVPSSRDNTPRWFYTNDNKITTGGNAYSPASGFRPLTENEFAELPQSIKDLISGEDTSFETLRLQGQYYITNDTSEVKQLSNDGKWQYYGQIDWNGKTYLQGFRGADGYAVDEEGNKLLDPTDNQAKNYSYYKGGVFLKNDCIWFKPSQLGKVRFVLYAGFNSGDATFQLVKVTREKATAENPFYTEDYSDISMQVIMAHNIASKYCLMYYEYQVTKEDLQPGVEFFISGYNASGANFIYMDIGASGEEQQDPDTGTLDTSKNVSSIDFVYDGVTINESGDFVEGEALYIATKIKVYYDSISATLYISFARTKNSDSVDFEVTYNGSAPSKSNGTGAVEFTSSSFTFTVP